MFCLRGRNGERCAFGRARKGQVWRIKNCLTLMFEMLVGHPCGYLNKTIGNTAMIW